MTQDWFPWVASIFSTIVGALISFFVQSKVLEKNRKWQLEDKEKERKWQLEDRTVETQHNIKLNRINLIEAIAKENFYSLREILSQMVDYRSNKINAQEVSNNIAALQNNLQYQSAMAKVVNDNKLIKCLFDFEEAFAEFTIVINSELSGIFSETDSLGECYGKMQVLYMDIIIRVDEIRMVLSKIHALRP